MRWNVLAAFAMSAMAPFPAVAQGTPPDAARLIDSVVIADVRNWLETEIVRLSVQSQNARHADVDSARIGGP